MTPMTPDDPRGRAPRAPGHPSGSQIEDPNDPRRPDAPGRSHGRQGDGDPDAFEELDESGTPEGAGTPEPAPGAAAELGTDFRDKWLRVEADLQNFRRRAQKDLEEGVRFAEDRLLLEMIGHLDDLERGLATARDAGAPGPWVQGVQLVASRMLDDLARHAVTPMKALGERFDPERHEALLEVDATDDTPPGHVAQVVREGYLRSGRVLRAARVVVARAPEKPGRS
jgi:molecular chaperone GrpE